MHFEYEFADGTRRVGPDVRTGETGWRNLPDGKLSRVSVWYPGGVVSIEKCDAYCIGVVMAGAAGLDDKIVALHLMGLTQKGIRLIEVSPLGINESMLPAEKAGNVRPWRAG